MIRFLFALLWFVGLPVAAPAAAAQAAQAAPGRAAPAGATPFARLVAQLSEPGAYFDTDNLISNENSYLHAVGELQRRGVRGGAYIGVGPDQSFSYIAAIRPEVAFIVDIRRDNLLQHLLLRALFVRAPTRLEFLALLHGRAPPPAPRTWTGRGIDDLVRYIDARGADSARVRRARRDIAGTIASFGVPLTAEDRATIERFHGEFIREGLGLRFETHGRPPQPYYPTYRRLLQERDLAGRQVSFLASEASYRLLRDMQRRGAIVPVVGDLGGDRAVRAIGDHLRARRLTVSAFYTSNVEFYLAQGGTLGRFADNVRSLPRNPRGVLIRSYFPGRFGPHPLTREGYHSTQLVQPFGEFLAAFADGAVPDYGALVMGDALR